jgi:hypothetical protein
VKKLIAFFGFVALFASCSSSDDSNLESSEILLKKLIQTSGEETYTTIYSYNGNKLVSASSSDDESIFYEYNGELLTTIKFFFNGNLSNIITNSFDASGRVVGVKNLSIGANQGFRAVYTYNDDNTISVATYYGDAENQETVDTPGKYFMDANGEIEKYERYGNSGTQTTTYTYDSKNNPYKNIEGYNDLINITGRNFNVTSVISTNSDDSVLAENAIEYSYNAENYPVNSVNNNSGAGAFTSQYFYE